MGLDKFVKGGIIETNEKKTALIFDTYNLIFRTLFVANSEDPLDLQFKYWKTLMLQSINATVRKFKPNRLILALDTGYSWRKKMYSEYKASRAKGREESPIDFDIFFPILKEFLESFKSTFKNCYVLGVDECEGDDLIAVLTKDILVGWDIICVSSDRDMYQLYKRPGYRQYDPIKKKFISCINPTQYLLLKVIMGDKGDNIPAIKEKTGPVGAEKILRNLDEALKDDQTNKNFIRNKLLIDFDCIPEDIATAIKKVWIDYQVEEFRGRALMDFFVKIGSNGLCAYLNEFVVNFKPLI